MSYAAQSPAPNEEDLPELVLAKAEPYLAGLTEWEVDLEEGELRRHLQFPDFAANIRFVNEIAKLAEAEDHHPDLAIRYDTLEIALSTHTISGLSLKDFIVAAKIEKLPR